MATKQRFRKDNEQGRRNAKDSPASSPMAYSRQVELVDLSDSRPLRPRNTGYTPRESLLSSPSTSSSSFPFQNQQQPRPQPRPQNPQQLQQLHQKQQQTQPQSQQQNVSLTPKRRPSPASNSSLLSPTSTNALVTPPSSHSTTYSSSISFPSQPFGPPSSPSFKSPNVTSALPQSASPNQDIDKATAQLASVLSETSLRDYTNISKSSNSNSQFAGAYNTNLSIEQREDLFRNCLSASSVDVDELRRLVWAHGLPSSSYFIIKSSAPWIRPLTWKLLTGYLPPDRSDWTNALANSRAEYWGLVHDATIDPSERPVDGDHPLNDEDSSQWREFFEDADIRCLISRDSKRTHPELDSAENNESDIAINMPLIREALDRLLFVYAKTHPGLGYRQGMNELAAIFLMVFFAEDCSNVYNNHAHNSSSSPSTTNNIGTSIDSSDVEADAYFCFQSIMNEMETCYVKDTETEGIGKQLRELQALLRIKDPQLEARLDELGIDPRFYGLRWLRLWVCREFQLEECLTLWDSFLTAEVRLPWIRYVCVAMLIRIRDPLLQSDFTKCMKLLLHYPDCNIPQLLRIADGLRTSNAVIVRTARS